MGVNISAQLEQALIGALILAPKNFVHVADIVKPEDFSDPSAKRAYLTAFGMWRSKKHVDLVSVAQEDMSLVSYLSESTSNGAAIGARDYARSISVAAKERRVNMELARVHKGNDPVNEKLDAILRLYQDEMFLVQKNPDVEDVLVRFEEYVAQNKKRMSMGVQTGFSFLDGIYAQYVPGHIWTMGAFTSVGKTAVMIQKVRRLLELESNPSIVVTSTEMTEQQLMARLLANFTGIHSQRIMAGNFRPGEEELVEEYKGMIRGKNLKIYDDVYTIGDIETSYRKADLQGGVDVGFIDYVQNCQVPEARSEYQEGAILAKRLQKLAKDVSCTLVCLSQVSNDVGRGNTDQLEYKGAGEWAAVADVGIHLQRHKEEKDLLKYTIKKNRHGQLGEFFMRYKSEFTRLSEVDYAN